MTFTQLDKLYNKYVYLKYDPDFLAIVLGTVISNRFDTEPVWLMIVAPPSGGKSRLLTPLEDCPECIMISMLTPASLVSSAKKADTHNGEEASLLSRLDGRNLIIRDATTFDAMDPKYRGQIFGQLRAAYDGMLEKSSGLGIKRFKAKFGMIVATTPATERRQTLDSSLGERFLYYRPILADENDPELWEKVLRQQNNETRIRKELADATIAFLKNFKEPKQLKSSYELIELGQCITKLRRSYHRDRRSRQIDFSSEKEMSMRVTKQLFNFYTALHSLVGKSRAMHIMKRITLDSAGYARKRVMSSLRHHSSVSSIAADIQTSRSHVQMVVEELVYSNVVSEADNSNSKIYTLKPEFENLYVVRPRT